MPVRSAERLGGIRTFFRHIFWKPASRSYCSPQLTLLSGQASCAGVRCFTARRAQKSGAAASGGTLSASRRGVPGLSCALKLLELVLVLSLSDTNVYSGPQATHSRFQEAAECMLMAFPLLARVSHEALPPLALTFPLFRFHLCTPPSSIEWVGPSIRHQRCAMRQQHYEMECSHLWVRHLCALLHCAKTKRAALPGMAF